MKKVNPRKRPVSMEDVRRVKAEVQNEALSLAMAIFFTVLLDKESADLETIQRVWEEVNDLSDSIAKGYVNLNDLRRTLNVEYDIKI